MAERIEPAAGCNGFADGSRLRGEYGREDDNPGRGRELMDL